MNFKNKYIRILIISSISLSVIVFAIIRIVILPNGDNMTNNNKEENQLIGKWLLVNTTCQLENEIIINTDKNEYNIEFFNNGTCKQLINYENNSWAWEKWTLRGDYIVFGENPLPPNGDYFIRIYYEFSEDGNRLSLYHAHLMTTRTYYKV